MALADRARKPFISPKSAYRVYHNVWLPSSRYPLAVTTFTQQQCIDIMKPVVQVMILKMGFNQNMPRVILYGKHKFGRFQFAHLYLDQGCSAVKHLMDYVRENTATGRQIMINLSQAQIIGGSAKLFLEGVKTNKKYTPNNWLSH
eukprot:3391070-Ditylum_brightwellii.AAC.1